MCITHIPINIIQLISLLVRPPTTLKTIDFIRGLIDLFQKYLVFVLLYPNVASGYSGFKRLDSHSSLSLRAHPSESKTG